MVFSLNMCLSEEEDEKRTLDEQTSTATKESGKSIQDSPLDTSGARAAVNSCIFNIQNHSVKVQSVNLYVKVYSITFL